MKKVSYLFLIFSSLFFVNSCKKITTLSPLPHVDFTNFSVYDTTDILGNKLKAGRLRFHFEDGDGDVGLDAPVNGQLDSTNLFVTRNKIKSGESIPDPKTTDFRIPYMERLGRDKILKGTISVTFLYSAPLSSDTITYDFYIKDRALNSSNVATTSEIILSVNKVYQ
jgi:hypothetical protein